MTYAQQLHQEGRQVGEEQGRIKGRMEGEINGLQTTIVGYLQFRFGGIPEGLAEAIASVRDLDRLHALQRLSWTCATLDDFASEL